MIFRIKIGLILLSLGVFSPLNLASAQAEGEGYTVERITDSMYLLRNPEVEFTDNVLVSVGSDGILLVDDAYEETESEIRSLIATLKEGAIDIIINTHYHHAGANDVFGEEALVIAHENTRTRMQTEQSMYGMRAIGPWSDVGLPDVTFDDRMSLHFNGNRIDAIHYPKAHTDGDVVVFFREANVVATGDVVVNHPGVCDYTSGCEHDRMLEAMKRLVGEIPEDAVIVPGHGAILSHADLVELTALLTEVAGRVRAAIEAGETEEQVVAKGLPERWEHWADSGMPMDFFLANVYRSVLAEAR